MAITDDIENHIKRKLARLLNMAPFTIAEIHEGLTSDVYAINCWGSQVDSIVNKITNRKNRINNEKRTRARDRRESTYMKYEVDFTLPAQPSNWLGIPGSGWLTGSYMFNITIRYCRANMDNDYTVDLTGQQNQIWSFVKSVIALENLNCSHRYVGSYAAVVQTNPITNVAYVVGEEAELLRNKLQNTGQDVYQLTMESIYNMIRLIRH